MRAVVQASGRLDKVSGALQDVAMADATDTLTASKCEARTSVDVQAMPSDYGTSEQQSVPHQMQDRVNSKHWYGRQQRQAAMLFLDGICRLCSPPL